jgi:hypothetical protein
MMKTPTLIAAGLLAAVALPANAATIDIAAGPIEATAATSIYDAPVLAYGGDWDDDDRRYRRGRGRYDDRWDDRRRDYRDERRLRRDDRVWRGRDGRYYCDRGDGTTGLVVGAVGGALLGRVIDRRGDRTVGTLLGGALGAVIGREIDRSELSCR